MAVGSGTMLGINSRLGFGNETTWGTRAAANFFLEFRSINIKKNIEEEKLESLGGGRSYIRRVHKNISVEGALTYDLQANDGIYLLKHALMGTVTSALATTASAYNHTMTLGDLSTISQKGISVEVQPDVITTTAFAYEGCRVNSLRISGGINAPVTAELNFIGKDATTVTFATATVTYSPTRPFLGQDITFQYGSSVGALSAEDIVSFELTLENNLQADDSSRSLGDRTLTALPPGRRSIMLNITQRYDTTTAYDRFDAATRGHARLTLDTGITIGADSPGTTYSMIIDLPNIFYNQAVPEISGPGVLTHAFEVSGIADTTSGVGLGPGNNEMVITVTNSATAYP